MINLQEQGKVLKKKINLLLINYFNFFIIFVVFLIFIIGTFFVLKPQYENAIIMIKDSSINERYKYNNKIKDLNELRAFLKDYSEISVNNILKVNDIIPMQYKKEDIFLGVKELIEKNGLKVDSINVDEGASDSKVEKRIKSEKNSKVGIMNVNVSISGINYDSLRMILDVFERNAPLIDVNSFSFSPTSEDKTETSDFSLDTYYYIDSGEK